MRELTRAFEQDGQQWANKMHDLLLEINDKVNATKTNTLKKNLAEQYRTKYRIILSDGDIECPDPKPNPNKKGKLKRTKSRNLLIRLRDFEEDVLRFMVEPLVPFTNNLGERDIRMTKVQQKISGCFRSMEGAITFCRVCSFLSTCKKNGVSASQALEMLFDRKLSDFIQEKINSG